MTEKVIDKTKDRGIETEAEGESDEHTKRDRQTNRDKLTAREGLIEKDRPRDRG